MKKVSKIFTISIFLAVILLVTACRNETIDPCLNGHKIIENRVEPTCTNDGKITKECEYCEYVETTPISALGHNMGEYKVTVEPSCSENGKERSECSRCDHYVERTIDSIGHTYGEVSYVWNDDNTKVTATRVCQNDSTHIETELVDTEYVVVIEPTCETAGKGVYTTLAFNNLAFEVQNKSVDFPAKGHLYDDVSYEWSNDFLQLKATRICLHDNSHVETETVSVDLEVINAPTCTVMGLGKYVSNTFTNTAFEVQTYNVELDALNHNYTEITYTWADDYGTLTASRECLNDSNHIEELTVSASYSIVKQSTCTEKGLGRVTSEDFGVTGFEVQTKDFILPELGHSYGEVSYEWNNDNTKVTATRICVNDSTHIQTETVDVTYEVTLKQTCTLNGKGTYTSNLFTNPAFMVQVKDIVLNNLDHDYKNPVENGNGTHKLTCENDSSHTTDVNCQFGNWEVVNEATDYESGLQKRTCEQCGYIETMTIPPLHTHIYSETFTVDIEATCETDGLKSRHCTVDNCMFVIDETVIPAYGHIYVLPTYVWNDDLSKVTATVVCNTDPRHIVTETVDAVYTVINAATCLEYGLAAYVSNTFENENFEVQYSYETLSPLNHDMSEYVETLSPTCTEEGSERSDCSRCDYYHEQAVNMLGHDMSEYVVTQPAGCLVDGLERSDCSRCDHYVEQTVGMLGHDMGEFIVTQPTTCEVGGLERSNCSRCNHYVEQDIEKLGHNYDSVIYTWSVDNDKVTATRICFNDASHIETETVNTTYMDIEPAKCMEEGTGLFVSDEFTNPAFAIQTKNHQTSILGHAMGVYVETLAPTCTEKGSERSDCSRCDYYEEKEIDKIGHTYGDVSYIWNDDNSKVTATRVCVNDSTHTETETVDVTYEIITQSTCENNGNGLYTTNRFNNSAFGIQVKEVSIEKTGHTEVIDEGVEPTTESTGLTTGSHCSICGVIIIEQQILGKLIELALETNNVNYGSVNGPNSGSAGNEITVSATSKPGYEFFGWFEEGTLVSKTQNYTFTMPDFKYTLTAKFVSNGPSVTDIWDGSVATKFTGGSGTSASPYLISTGAELAYLANSTNSGATTFNKYFKLVNNIDLNNLSWTPIGTASNPFKGIFVGNDCNIINMYINSNLSYVGLFGYGSNCEINSLKVLDFSINVTGYSYIYSGGIIGYVSNSGRIERCIVEGSVSANKSSDYNSNEDELNTYVGGIVGYGTILGIAYCDINVNVDGWGYSCYVGGVAGYLSSYSSIYSTNVKGTINAKGHEITAGGLAGTTVDITIKNNVSSINVYATSTYKKSSENESYIGGLIGFISGSSSLYYCSVNGNVSTSQANNTYTYTGGLVGYQKDGEVMFSYVTGNVIGGSFVGGLIGYQNRNTNMSTINACLFIGDLKTDVSTSKIGRVIGGCDSSPFATSCYGLEGSAILNGTTTITGTSYGSTCTLEQLSDETFYSSTLGWSKSEFNYETIDINNKKLPTPYSGSQYVKNIDNLYYQVRVVYENVDIQDKCFLVTNSGANSFYGKYKIILYATAQPGTTFEGWYLGDQKVTSSSKCEVIVTNSDLVYTAKYIIE